MTHKILILSGPNLNLLGRREPGIYGADTLDVIHERLQSYAKEANVELRTFQSNSEGAIIDAIHEAGEWAEGIVINAGAYTHYSIAIRDAVAAINIPAVEVHLSNVYAREEMRHKSLLAPICLGIIAGFGWRSYLLGLMGLINHLSE